MSPPSQFCSCVATAQLSVVVEYLVLQLGEETAVQSVVGSIVWAFLRLKKPRSREMSARGYALHRICPQISFFSFGNRGARPTTASHGLVYLDLTYSM